MNADILVIGAGPVGLMTTLALGQAGCSVICTGPRIFNDPQKPDTRTTALFQGSVNFLKNLGLWTELHSSAEALKKIRILDDTRYLLRAPETIFDSSELGLDAFGYNIENVTLVRQLHNAIAVLPNVTYLETKAVQDIQPNPENVVIRTVEGHNISAKLVVGADGRHSPSRQAAKIEVVSWSYPQTALACNLHHSNAHDSISNEFHREAGPFTTVPLGEKRSSLVWVEHPSEASRLMALSEHEFISEVEKRLHGLLGKIGAIGQRSSFALSGLSAKTFAQNRIALVGEAAHVIPPIGAQGLNLGLRDAALLCETLKQKKNTQKDIGEQAILERYNAARRADIWSRVITIDLLNRSLISGFLPAQMARKFGLSLLNQMGPLRRLVMRQGIQPDYALPELMRA